MPNLDGSRDVAHHPSLLHLVKATDLVSLRKSVSETNPKLHETIRAALSAELRDALDGATHSTWMPDPQICAIYDCFCAYLFPKTPTAQMQLGRQMALSSYRGVYRVFLAIPSTTFVMKRAANVWASYHSTGKAAMEEVEDRAGVLVVRGADPISPCMIEIVAGHTLALAELTGAKDARVVPDARDPSALRWAIRWK